MTKEIYQGDIVLVPFPFSDLSDVKTRPALVISNHRVNSTADILFVSISRTKPLFLPVVPIEQKNLIDGTIPEQSFVHFHKIHLIEKSLVQKVVARIEASLFQDIIAEIGDIVSFEEKSFSSR